MDKVIAVGTNKMVLINDDVFKLNEPVVFRIDNSTKNFVVSAPEVKDGGLILTSQEILNDSEIMLVAKHHDGLFLSTVIITVPAKELKNKQLMAMIGVCTSNNNNLDIMLTTTKNFVKMALKHSVSHAIINSEPFSF